MTTKQKRIERLKEYIERSWDGWFLSLQASKTQVVPLGQPYSFLLKQEQELFVLIFSTLSGSYISRETILSVIRLTKTIRNIIFNKPV